MLPHNNITKNKSCKDLFTDILSFLLINTAQGIIVMHNLLKAVTWHPVPLEMCLTAPSSTNLDQEMFLSHPSAMFRFPSSDQMRGNPAQLER